MQTFKQFLEAREVRDIPQNDIYEILPHIKDPIISVRFALYCAEDCFQFNNEETREPAQQCIDLVRKWLRNPESVTRQELTSVINKGRETAYNVGTIPGNAVLSAVSAVYVVESIIEKDNYFLLTAASVYAIFAFLYASGYQRGTPQWINLRNQKRQEYRRKLKGMTTTRSGHSTSIEPLKGYDNTHLSIMAALDSLEEIGEIGKDHFVYQDNDGQWVFDLGHDNILRADSKEALAELIHNDKYYLNALLRLYNANV